MLKRKMLEEIFGSFDQLSYVTGDKLTTDCECGQKVNIEKVALGKMEAVGGVCGNCETLHIRRKKSMKNEHFAEVCKEIIHESMKIMDNKKSEYAVPVDCLINFKRRAKLLETNPGEVIVSDLTKHMDVLIQAAKTGNYRWCWEDEKGEGLKQRIADTINYLQLLAGYFEETNESRKEHQDHNSLF